MICFLSMEEPGHGIHDVIVGLPMCLAGQVRQIQNNALAVMSLVRLLSEPIMPYEHVYGDVNWEIAPYSYP